MHKPQMRSWINLILLILVSLRGLWGFSASSFQALASELFPGVIHSPWEPTKANPSRPSVNRMRLESGQFLIASKEMLGLSFHQTVVLLLDHDWHGTIGVVINRPTRIPLSQFHQPTPDDPKWPEHQFWGGPVSSGTLVMLVHSDKSAEGMNNVVEDVFWVQDSSLMKQILKKGWPAHRIHLYMGYAGWAPGQLEDEIMRGSWYIVSADASVVFGSVSSEIWQELFFQSTSKWGLLRQGQPKPWEVLTTLLIPRSHGTPLTFDFGIISLMQLQNLQMLDKKPNKFSSRYLLEPFIQKNYLNKVFSDSLLF